MKIQTSKGKLPIRYNMNALRKIGDEFDITMNEVFELSLANRKMSDVFTFVLHGFIEGARLEKEECKVATLDEIGDILEEDPQVLSDVLKAFAADMQEVKSKKEDGKKK
jgi:hypothetical protein